MISRPDVILAEDTSVENVVAIEIGEKFTLAIGRAHTLETAVSDIIDNSIGAMSSRVWVRFLESKGRITHIRIRDNGTGMDAVGLSDAMKMTDGGRKYRSNELGMFGLGMKGSSMSQAKEMNIYTSPEHGRYFGTRLLRQDAGGALSYGVLTDQASREGYFGSEDEESTGTVVEWKQLDNVSLAGRQEARDEWISDKITALRHHLGLVFHRFLETGALRIIIERFDIEGNRPGVPVFVKELDPFKFDRSGHEDFPRTLTAKVPNSGTFNMECHIIPSNSRTESALLMGEDRQRWQGLYIYWRNRLIHFGDWGNLVTPKKELLLARVKIDLTDRLSKVVKLNPEKAQIVPLPQFVTAAHEATDAEGLYVLETYLERAAATLKRDSSRASSLKPVTRISSGMPTQVIKAIESSVGWRPSHNGLSMDWAFLPNDQFFDFQTSTRTIRLNSRHRAFLSATETSSHEDAPVVRTLLFLLLESYFSAGHIKKSTEEQIVAIQEILSAALRVQLDEIEFHGGHVKEEPEDNLEAVPAKGGTSVSEVSDSVVFAEPLRETAEILPTIEPEPATDRALPTTLPPIPRPRPSRFIAAQSKASTQESAVTPTGDSIVAILKQYRSGISIKEVAAQLGQNERSVVTVLAWALFGSKSTENDQEIAPRHGISWSPDERNKASKMHQQGASVASIASKIGRTPLSVAWQLLDGPKALTVPDAVIKQYQKALKGEGRDGTLR
jgi:hypothetical protein